MSNKPVAGQRQAPDFIQQRSFESETNGAGGMRCNTGEPRDITREANVVCMLVWRRETCSIVGSHGSSDGKWETGSKMVSRFHSLTELAGQLHLSLLVLRAVRSRTRAALVQFEKVVVHKVELWGLPHLSQETSKVQVPRSLSGTNKSSIRKSLSTSHIGSFLGAFHIPSKFLGLAAY
jgi:hypothetical protein